MVYEKPSIGAAQPSVRLIQGQHGSGKPHNPCRDGGASKTAGAYEIDE